MAGKRYSKQREMVYRQLKTDNPSLSLGTVYRNLNLLADEGVLVRMPFPVERYDACVEPHAHFKCRACREVFDLPMEEMAGLDELASGAVPGFLVERHELLFHGLCPHCRGGERTAEA